MTRRDPLETILRLKQIRERQARADLAAAQSDVRAHAEEMAEIRRRLSATDAPAADLTPVKLLALQLMGIRSAELLDEAARVLEESERRLTYAREHWWQTKADEDSTEELVRRRKDHAAARARAIGERALDELMAARRKKGRP